MLVVGGDGQIGRALVPALARTGHAVAATSRRGGRVLDLAGWDGLVLRLLGDGKTYGVRLRTDSRFDGVSYQAKLATEAGRWIEARLPFAEFRPVFRGREVRGHPALDPGTIRSFGLIISDQQEGPFGLQIDWIKTYRERPGT